MFFLIADINECVIDNGGCSELCENTEGSYFCACEGDERALSPDGKSCLGMTIMIYFYFLLFTNLFFNKNLSQCQYIYIRYIECFDVPLWQE